VSLKALKNLLLYFFPEPNIWQNILAVFIGLVISSITYLISVNIDARADSIALGVSFGYFMIKNLFYLEMNNTAQELFLLLM